MESRNPFRIRKTEQFGSESKFHVLFGPHMLNLLKRNDECLWDRLQIIRSAPGGGKTSLLRLFTAESLNIIHNYRHSADPDYRFLFDTIESLGAISESGPSVLGILMSCTRPYSLIEYLRVDEKQKDRLFFALLNARALFGVLKSACSLTGLQFPSDLEKVEIRPMVDVESYFNNFFCRGNGRDLYGKVCLIEQKVCAAIDSIGEPNLESVEGISGLLVWRALGEGSILCNGEILNAKPLFMLDDVHELNPRQRKLLLKELELRVPTATWVAERYDALDRDVILNGSTIGREFNEYQIEEWALKSKALFQKGLKDIADRRVASAKTIELAHFEPLLDLVERDRIVLQKYEGALTVITKRVSDISIHEQRFKTWIRKVQNAKYDTKLQELIGWRALEILIKRKQKRDFSLFPDLELPVEEFDKMDRPEINKAAELFLSSEFDIPYYHGFDILKLLASGNIEQFLDITGSIFDEVLATATLRNDEPKISADRQQTIILGDAKNRFDQIPQRMIYGSKVQLLVQHIGHLARSRTFEKTAPYAPGVTGIAISSDDLRKLSDKQYLKKHPEQEEVANVLREAISKNIFETRKNQACKNQQWFVIYLNRLLCSYFGLPLDYGGWREQSLNTLSKWLNLAPEKKSSIKELFKNE
jgi:hypothetical protein